MLSIMFIHVKGDINKCFTTRFMLTLILDLKPVIPSKLITSPTPSLEITPWNWRCTDIGIGAIGPLTEYILDSKLVSSDFLQVDLLL